MPKVQLLQPLRGLDGIAEKRRAEMHSTHIALLYLRERWPEAFTDDTAQVHPLAIGSRDKLLEETAQDPSAPDQKWIARALALWCGSTPYLRAIAEGKPRVNLDGSFAGHVDPQHVDHAKQRIEKLKARGRARAEQRKQEAIAKAALTRAPIPPTPPPLGLGRPTLTLRRRTA